MFWKRSPGPALFCFAISTAIAPFVAGAVPAAAMPGVEQAILSTFEQINMVPRCSKDETRISAWLADWARRRTLQVHTDALDNVLITVPATPGWENRSAVVLQAHMDMVCIREEGSAHDFTRDPIPLIRDGDWIHARGTTLGADNGIGVALALTLAEKADTPHPKLELLFTADEEKDMSGAAGLKPDLFTGRRLINLDSENDSVVTLGAAGGIHTDIMLPLDMQVVPPGWEMASVEVSGLLGGHSGMEIGKNRPNATVLLAQLLAAAGEFRLVEITGGSADNAIATSAEATLALPSSVLPEWELHAASFEKHLRAQYPAETGVKIVLVPAAEAASAATSVTASAAAVRLIADLPQGVVAWSRTFEGLPETSSNVGIVRSSATALTISSYQRSSDEARLKALASEIAGLAQQAGASSSQRGGFPAWPPHSQTALYKAVLSAHAQVTGEQMSSEVTHAGLECGYFAAKYPDMEIVSIGPNIEGVHTTGERLNVPSITKVWKILQLVLQAP